MKYRQLNQQAESSLLAIFVSPAGRFETQTTGFFVS